MGVTQALQVPPPSGGVPQTLQQSWPVAHWALVVQLAMKEGAGTRSVEAGTADRVARNCAVESAGGAVAAGVWAMACANGRRARRARRTRTGFFIGSSPRLIGPAAGRPSKGEGAPTP